MLTGQHDWHDWRRYSSILVNSSIFERGHVGGNVRVCSELRLQTLIHWSSHISCLHHATNIEKCFYSQVPLIQVNHVNLISNTIDCPNKMAKCIMYIIHTYNRVAFNNAFPSEKISFSQKHSFGAFRAF